MAEMSVLQQLCPDCSGEDCMRCDIAADQAKRQSKPSLFERLLNFVHTFVVEAQVRRYLHVLDDQHVAEIRAGLERDELWRIVRDAGETAPGSRHRFVRGRKHYVFADPSSPTKAVYIRPRTADSSFERSIRTNG